MKTVSYTQKVLNVWAVILILWSIYRAKLALPEWFDEFIAKPLIFILPVYLFIRKVEKGNFFSKIALRKENSIREFYYAIFIGISLLFVVIVAKLAQQEELAVNTKTILYAFAQFPFVFATAFSEEILARGFILKRLYGESHNIITSTFVASILFLIIQIPILFTNLNLTGNLIVLFIITDLILSFANSFIFLYRRSLIVPIFVHAFYNLILLLAL